MSLGAFTGLIARAIQADKGKHTLVWASLTKNCDPCVQDATGAQHLHAGDECTREQLASLPDR